MYAAETGRFVVVHHACCLHEGVARGRPHEPAAEFLERTAQRVRYFGGRRSLRIRRAWSVYSRAANKRPHECSQGAVLSLDSLNRARVGDGGRNLRAVPDDACIEQEFCGVVFSEGGDLVDIEVVKQRLVAFALVEDRGPGQASLCAFEHEHFEKVTIVV